MEAVARADVPSATLRGPGGASAPTPQGGDSRVPTRCFIMGAVPHVIIVGGGPAGAALAYLLASRALQVTLIERQSDFAREFRGEVLMPSGQAVFDELGLREAFDALPHSEPRRAELHPGLRHRISVDFGEDLQGGPRIVSQPAMLEMLVERASAFPNFEFHRGVQVSDVLHEGERACGVKLGDGREIRGDLVVGADGRGSLVRRKSGLDAPHDSEIFDIVWFKVPYPEFLAARGKPVQGYFGRGHLAINFPSPEGDALQVAWVIRKGTFGELRRQGVEAWVREMAGHVRPELGDHLRQHADRLDRPFVLDVVCYLLPEWWKPGVVLVGDACHPMSPVGGQGINIALRDIVVLANHLVPVLRAGDDAEAVDTALEAYTRERSPEVETVQGFQRAAPKVLLSDGWRTAMLMQVLRILRFGPVRRFAARHGAAPLLEGTCVVRLRV